MYLLNADNISAADIPKDAFVVYQGHHGDTGAVFADVILPGAAYTEKAATYVNTEGRSQMTRAAVPPPGGAREDWKIIRALSDLTGKSLPYDDIHALRDRMNEVSPTLVAYDARPTTAFASDALKSFTSRNVTSAVSKVPFDLAIRDFYMTDPISRASSTMAKCSAAFVTGKGEREEMAFA